MGKVKELITDDWPDIVNLADLWEEINDDPEIWNDSEDTNESLENILRRGKKNALPAATLCSYFGTDRRSIGRAIAAARREGLPVCASVGELPGYYLAKDKQEMRQYCRSLEGRIKKLNTILQCCRDMIAGLPE